MDDFLSLYLALNTCKAFDYGFGLEDKAPWQAQERNISTKQHHYDFLHLLSIFTIISMTITNKIGEHKLCSHQKLTRKICADRDLSSLHQCTIARRFRNLQVEMKLGIKLSLMN